MFEEVYARMGGELPALTRGIIALSKAFPAYVAVAVIAGGGLYLLYRANRQREEVQRWRAAILFRLPVAGEIIRKNMQAQCCKLLDLLCAAGVPLLAGVGMLREVIGFHPYRKSFDEIAHRLERGDAFAETLARFPDLYDRKLTALVRVGEQTNRLPEMLRRQGENPHRRTRIRNPPHGRNARTRTHPARRNSRRRDPNRHVYAHVLPRRNHGVKFRTK